MRAKMLLLSEHPGWFYRLCKDYELGGIVFSENNIHALTDSKGILIDDIRDEEDNRNAADSIAERIRLLTADPECALHVSLAGGRKTMSFFAGYALSLFGRPQDRLSHVLVQAEYEFSPEFFYPLPQSHTIEGKERRLLDASTATVTLAEIPFVRMRDRLPKELLSGKESYSVVVQAADRVIGPAELVIDQQACRIRAGGMILTLQRAPIAFLSFFARRTMQGKRPIAAPAKSFAHRALSKQYTREYYRCGRHAEELPEVIPESLIRPIDGDRFSLIKSRLHDGLEKALGGFANPYLISDGGKRPRMFQCTLPPHAIRFSPLQKQEELLPREIKKNT